MSSATLTASSTAQAQLLTERPAWKALAEHYQTVRGQHLAAALRRRSPAWRALNECLSDRVEAPATPEQKRMLSGLSPQRVLSKDLAGERILSILSHAPGNDAPIGGLK